MWVISYRTVFGMGEIVLQQLHFELAECSYNMSNFKFFDMHNYSEDVNCDKF